MKRKYIIVFLLVIMLFKPNYVNALTEEEVDAKLENLPFEKIYGKYYFETSIIAPDIKWEMNAYLQ